MARILGIDYGEKRVGIAISDFTGMLATPVRIAQVASDKQALTAIQAACRELEAEKVVIGLPINMDGTRGPMAQKVEAFAQSLRETGLVVELYDERLSTSLVERVLIDADLSRARRKQVRDKLAAQVVLQGYLDRNSLPSPAAPGADGPESWETP